MQKLFVASLEGVIDEQGGAIANQIATALMLTFSPSNISRRKSFLTLLDKNYSTKDRSSSIYKRHGIERMMTSAAMKIAFDISPDYNVRLPRGYGVGSMFSSNILYKDVVARTQYLKDHFVREGRISAKSAEVFRPTFCLE